MKHSIVLVMLAFVFSIHAHGGVGGISGGHIQFQDFSTFVHPVYEKSLCFDGEAFHAKVNKCLEWKTESDNRVCVRSTEVWAKQPMESSRERCKHFEGSDGTCLAWERVPLVQYPNRFFEFKDEDERVLKRVEFRVKDCR